MIQHYGYELQTSYTFYLFFTFSSLCLYYVTCLIEKLDYIYWLLLFLIRFKFGHTKISMSKNRCWKQPVSTLDIFLFLNGDQFVSIFQTRYLTLSVGYSLLLCNFIETTFRFLVLRLKDHSINFFFLIKWNFIGIWWKN